ncbi:DUF262 domain-containing HNH endonuclease family protein [Cyanobacterium sp. Dongsha4]|uniref:DUF262 domain-containing protein n=1 Tax=Cyanobacterium sp. DS4 TaxID=2878255 RepID=UPI002E804B35|nr:DUF262 domain-containing HNH endonuclease family protein [Cyanobacterium sp. Dongsha4]WVL01631.1 DUF262 domain-containing HNH endonuclease family protein [Cyanobacterium sp. Dongsha4]
MGQINLLDTRTSSFGDLLGNGKIYQVPLFQRDYSWQEENWEDLWQDILILYHNPPSSHYMGAIVLQNSTTSDKQFTIIDGQQRLATLSIIAITVIEGIKKLVEADKDKEANQERQEILRRTYLGDKDPRSLRYSSKILLNENNNDFYQSHLINLRKPRNARILSKSNQLLWNAFEYFTRELEKLTDVIATGEKLTEFLTDVIAQKLLFIQINVEDELNAYTVFETLNARGIELSATDLLKNYLFSLFESNHDLQEAQRQWRRIINTVSMAKFPEFLRYYLSTKEIRVRRERLFKIVRESVKNGLQAFNLLDELEDYSGLFMALSNPHDDFWLDTPENRSYIRELDLFRVKQAYPIFFSAYDKFSREDFTRLLRLVSVISFRYHIVSSLNPNELEAIYNKVAVGISQNDITNPRQVFEKVRSIYVSDDKFSQDFSIMSISTKGQKKKLVKYILCKLESYISGLEINEDSFSIEHILPESPSNQWQEYFTDNQIEEMVYRLGNMTLLEPNLNREIGNKKYTLKREIYQQSNYQLTQKIQAEEWNPQSLNRRQIELAKKAIQIWRSSF